MVSRHFSHERVKLERQLFLLIRHPELVSSIIPKRPCMHGKFGAAFLKKNTLSGGGLTLARLKLITIACIAYTEISGIEALHAFIRNLTVVMGTRNAADIVRIVSNFSVRHVRTLPDHVKDLVPSNKGPRIEDVGAGDDASTLQVAKRPATELAKQHRRGGGYRAFVSQTHAGGKFQAGMGKMYREQDPHILDDQRNIGAIATINGQTDPSSSAFRARKKDVEKARRVAVDQVVVSKLRRVGEAAVCRDALESSAVVSAGTRGENLFTSIRRVARQLGSIILADRKDVVTTLACYAGGEGKTNVSDVCARLGLSDAMQKQLVPTGCSHVPTATYRADCAGRAAALVGWQNAGQQHFPDPNKTMVGKLLDAETVRQCTMIRHDDCRPLRDDDFVRESKCYIHQHCFCSDDGQKRAKLRNDYYNTIKALCPLHSAKREKLLARECFVLLRGELSDLHRAQLAESGAADVNGEDGLVATVWHLADVVSSPFHIAYQEMVLDDITENFEYKLRATQNFNYDYHQFVKLSLHRRWSLELLLLRKTKKPQAISPEYVVALSACWPKQPCDDDEHLFFDPDRKPPKRRKRAKAKGKGDGKGKGGSGGSGGSAVITGGSGVAGAGSALPPVVDKIADDEVVVDVPDDDLQNASEHGSDSEHSVHLDGGPSNPADADETGVVQPSSDMQNAIAEAALWHASGGVSAASAADVGAGGCDDGGGVAGDGGDGSGDDHNTADFRCRVPNGRIFFYEDRGFECICRVHEDCVKTRTHRGGKGRPKAQGRPLGYLIYWLSVAHDFLDKESHFKAATPLEYRQTARELARLTVHGFEDMEDKERPRRHDEENEPIKVS